MVDPSSTQRRPDRLLIDRVDPVHAAVLKVVPRDLFTLGDLVADRARLTVTQSSPPVTAEGVKMLDLTIAGYHGHPLLLRLYLPDRGDEPLPALLWLHGGGFFMGSPDQDDAYCARLASDVGVVVASPDYRLVPEHPYPIPAEDCYAALRWLVANCTEYGVDRRRIAIGGASAGGGLAAAVTLLARERLLRPRIALQFLVYPMLDDRSETPARVRATDARVWTDDANAKAWRAYLRDVDCDGDVPPAAVPGRVEDLSDLPPAYIKVGDSDGFADECIAYATRLIAVGVPVELHVYAGAFHGSNILVSRSELSRRWYEDDVALLTRQLHHRYT